MAINAKILLDPKFYYQKLKELASKTKSSAQQVSDDVKKAGKSALSELKGDNITPGSLMKRIFLGGGALAIIQKGIQSVFNLFDTWMKNKKAEITDMLASFDDVGHQYDRFDKQQQDKSSANQSALSTLSGLQMSDAPLNNVQKEQQRQTIETLRKSYRGLKIDVDDATGKIKNFEDVQSQVLSGDQKKELDLVQRQIRNIEKQNGVAENAVQYKGGAFSEYWANLKETYGWGAAQEAGGVQKKNVDKLMDLRMREYQLKHSDRAADATAMYRAQVADRSDRLADPEASAAKKFALDEQIGETEKRLAALKAPKVGVEVDTSEVTKMEERLAALKKQREAMPKTKREQYEDSEKEQTPYLRLIAEGRKEEAELLKFINDRKKEGIAYTEAQAKAFLEERKNIATAQYYQEATEALDDQLKIQRLLIQGKIEEAERQKIINELRKSGKTVDEAKVDELMKKKSELGSLNLQKSQKQEFESLYDKALRAAGRTKEADETAALKRARDTKGSDLTGAEEDTVRKLAALTEKLNNLGNGPNLGDMSIKTNSLTARGGFATGVRVPEADKINREIANYNKSQVELLRQISDVCKNLGVFK